MNLRVVPVLLCLALGACAPAVYQMTAMPRDSGATYAGTIVDSLRGDGTVTVTIAGRTYSGAWTRTAQQGNDYIVSGIGGAWGPRWGAWGATGGITTATRVDPGAAWIALLKAGDGSGLRCDMTTDGNGNGGGTCRDDSGKLYDVQFRPTKG